MSFRRSRRDFLRIALASLTTLGCSNESDAPATESSAATKPASQAVAHYFSDDGLAAATTIGKRWLDQTHPNAADAEIDGIVAPTVAVISGGTDDDATIEALRARVQADFAIALASNVDGWTFADTELHLCVLAGRGR